MRLNICLRPNENLDVLAEGHARQRDQAVPQSAQHTGGGAETAGGARGPLRGAGEGAADGLRAAEFA